MFDLWLLLQIIGDVIAGSLILLAGLCFLIAFIKAQVDNKKSRRKSSNQTEFEK